MKANSNFHQRMNLLIQKLNLPILRIIHIIIFASVKPRAAGFLNNRLKSGHGRHFNVF